MKVKSESEVAQSYLTPSNPVDCSLPGSSVHGIFQARVLEPPLSFRPEQSPEDAAWEGRGVHSLGETLRQLCADTGRD